MHIVTVAEMRELEARAEREYGLTSHILMQNAGKSAADLFQAHLLPHYTMNGPEAAPDTAINGAVGQSARGIEVPPDAATNNASASIASRSGRGTEVLFLIGPGNNGGDGLVVAHHLEEAGAFVTLYHWKERRLIVRGQEISEEKTAAELVSALNSAEYVIDALLGTGRSRPLPDDMRTLLGRVQQKREQRGAPRIVAIDLPTGLNADTGEVDPATLHADSTITLACPKQGFFFFPGRDYIGELYVGDIGLPPTLERDLPTEMLTAQLVRDVLPPRPLESNKGTFGKVMLFCGSFPYPGSAYLAGSAAGRVGAGLVTLAVTERMLPIYASSYHEATFALLPPEDVEGFERANVLIEHLPGYRSLLMGPGLGQSANTRETILQVLEHLRSLSQKERPQLVVDADGLNNLSALERWWTLLPPGTVITPHPGEMSRLCGGTKVSGGNIDRLALARSKAREWQVTLVLKGACTIIAEPDGRTRINWLANPALAAAGTGDVLAGMIAGFLAQEMQPFDAAGAAVYLHTAAAGIVSEQLGHAGMLASDLLPNIPRAIVTSRGA